MATEMKRATTPLARIEELLGENARTLLDHKSEAISQRSAPSAGSGFYRPRLGCFRSLPGGFAFDANSF